MINDKEICVENEQCSSASSLKLSSKCILGLVCMVKYKVCLKGFPWSGGQWLLQAMPLLRFRHPNVIQVVGISTSSIEGDWKPQAKVLTEIVRSLIDKRMKMLNGKGTPFK